MKKKLLFLMMALGVSILLSVNCSASNDNIVLNKPLTNDVEHTFKYPNLFISSNVKPYSITLSIENGYFKANNDSLNEEVSTYFDFRGGTNTTNDYISLLDPTQDYKLITFNLKSSVDLTDSAIKENVIKSIKNFLSDILFYNDADKDAKFTLTFSEAELKFSNQEYGIDNIDVIAFKGANQSKEHYYAKILNPGILWTDAYNVAAGLKWNGLQGYLVTITSEDEHNFIYQSLGSIRGWMGSAAIENYDSVTYNTKNILWNDAMDVLMHYGTGYTNSGSENDNKLKQYWRWVAGPEAGNKVFEDNAFTRFNGGEPNNYASGEWCGEYGHGDNGKWNDYPNYASDIQGYYIEFGGFDDDNETIKPVSLVSTFKWKDYDFRNIEKNIEDEFDKINLNEQVTEEELKTIIDNAINNTGISETTYIIKNKTINGNILSFDLEISIGTEENKTTTTIKISKQIEVEPKEEDIDIPQTSDKLLNYILVLVVSIIGITACIIKLKKNKKI